MTLYVIKCSLQYMSAVLCLTLGLVWNALEILSLLCTCIFCTCSDACKERILKRSCSYTQVYAGRWIFDHHTGNIHPMTLQYCPFVVIYNNTLYTRSSGASDLFVALILKWHNLLAQTGDRNFRYELYIQQHTAPFSKRRNATWGIILSSPHPWLGLSPDLQLQSKVIH